MNRFRLNIAFILLAFSRPVQPTHPAQLTSSCEFALIIPSFNNEKYYKENLDSACWQESTHPYHIYYINDCSTDATGQCVEAYIKEHHLENKVTLINNTVNIGAGANIYHTIHTYIPDNKIVVLLDGDDLFPHNNVFLKLESYYRDPNLWITYGLIETFPEKDYFGAPIPDDIYTKNLMRKNILPSFGGPLRSFKAALFKKIKKETFFYKGEFMKVTHDLAYMLAMLEMSSPKDSNDKKHARYIDEALYLYRYNNPISDFRIRGELQLEVDRYIRSLDPYQPIGSLD